MLQDPDRSPVNGCRRYPGMRRSSGAVAASRSSSRRLKRAVRSPEMPRVSPDSQSRRNPLCLNSMRHVMPHIGRAMQPATDIARPPASNWPGGRQEGLEKPQDGRVGFSRRGGGPKPPHARPGCPQGRFRAISGASLPRQCAMARPIVHRGYENRPKRAQIAPSALYCAGAQERHHPRHRNSHARRLRRHGKTLSVRWRLREQDMPQEPRQLPWQLRVAERSLALTSSPQLSFGLYRLFAFAAQAPQTRPFPFSFRPHFRQRPVAAQRFRAEPLPSPFRR